jgi:uncharacterized membrane protein
MNQKFEIRLGDALKDAWAIFMKGPEVFVSLTFLYFAVVFVLGGLPVVGQLISFLFFSLLPAAFILAAESGRGDGKITFESLQKIMPIAPQLLALGVAKSILIMLGFMLLVLPGIYVMLALAFAELFLVLRNTTFVDAMKESQKLAHENLFGVLGMMIVCVMLAISGALLIGIGLLVSIPVAVLVPYCVFRRASERPVVEPASAENVKVVTPEIMS